MGCDIHICIQAQDADGEWREIQWQQAPYNYEGAEKPVPDIPIAPEQFRSRNYDLFAILADVRNGVGFAGIKTGEGWPSIAPDRGLPDGFQEDALLPDPCYPEDAQRWIGDHSFTWIALDELKSFAWDVTATQIYGVVPAGEYERLTVERAIPRSYSGGIVGAGIVTYEPDAYRLAKTNGVLAKRPYVRMAWTETAREATNNWPGDVIPWLDSLAAGRPLRLVLGFDS